MLLDMFREAKAKHDGDPVAAWAEITCCSPPPSWPGWPPRCWGNLLGHPHDYRLGVAPYFRSVFYAHPDTGLIASAPVGFQIHVMLAWVLFAAWPFTRLVRVFSAPFGYLTRPYIMYRSRGLPATDLPARRGWEPGQAAWVLTGWRRVVAL